MFVPCHLCDLVERIVVNDIILPTRCDAPVCHESYTKSEGRFWEVTSQ